MAVSAMCVQQRALSSDDVWRVWAEFSWGKMTDLGTALGGDLARFAACGGCRLYLLPDADAAELQYVPPEARVRIGNVAGSAERYELGRNRYVYDQLRARRLAWCSTSGRRKRGEATEESVHGNGLHNLEDSVRFVRIGPARLGKGGEVFSPSEWVTIHTTCPSCQQSREKNRKTGLIIPNGRLIMLDRVRRGGLMAQEDAELGDRAPKLLKLYERGGELWYFDHGKQVPLTLEWDGGKAMVPTIELTGRELSELDIHAPPFVINLACRPYYQVSILQGGKHYRLFLRNQ